MANDRYSTRTSIGTCTSIGITSYLLILAFSLYRTVSASEIARTGRRNARKSKTSVGRPSHGPVLPTGGGSIVSPQARPGNQSNQSINGWNGAMDGGIDGPPVSYFQSVPSSHRPIFLVLLFGPVAFTARSFLLLLRLPGGPTTSHTYITAAAKHVSFVLVPSCTIVRLLQAKPPHPHP